MKMEKQKQKEDTHWGKEEKRREEKRREESVGEGQKLERERTETHSGPVSYLKGEGIFSSYEF